MSTAPYPLLTLVRHGFACLEVQIGQIAATLDDLSAEIKRHDLTIPKLEPVPPYEPGPEPDRYDLAHYVAWSQLGTLSAQLARLDSQLLGVLSTLSTVLILKIPPLPYSP